MCSSSKKVDRGQKGTEIFEGAAFEGRRAAPMHLPQLPTLEEAIAAMAQEETRLKQIEKVEVVPRQLTMCRIGRRHGIVTTVE